MQERVNQLAEWILCSRKTVVFTGAGMSTESGIPDFRSPGGIWSKFDPEDFTFQRFLSSDEARRRYWEMGTGVYQELKRAEPNPGHRAIAQMERHGRLDCVITQNIDGLHQAAGNAPERVIELHGTALAVGCLSCGRRYDRDGIQERIARGEQVPRCDACQGLLKPATISFGQQMPERETMEAFRRAEACDLLLVVGSSLVVQPAASIPVAAKRKGAKLVIINRDPTPLDHLADLVINGSAGEALSRALAEVEARISREGLG